MKPIRIEMNRGSKLIIFLCGLLVCAVAAQGCDKSERETSDNQDNENTTPGNGYPSTGILFTSEIVIMDVEENRLKVEGTYNFKNPSYSDWSGRIAYPIYVDQDQPAAEHVLLEGEDEPLEVRCLTPDQCLAVIFLELEAGETRSIKLSYEQHLLKNRAVYLLTTAQSWDRPLEKAELVVKIDRNFENVQISYTPDREEMEGSKKVYTIERTDFIPDRELEVSWSDPG